MHRMPVNQSEAHCRVAEPDVAIPYTVTPKTLEPKTEVGSGISEAWEW